MNITGLDLYLFRYPGIARYIYINKYKRMHIYIYMLIPPKLLDFVHTLSSS